MDRFLTGSRARSRMARLAASLAVCFALSAAAVPSAARAATVPAGFVGLNDWAMPSDDVLTTVSGMGIKRWRAGLFWYRVERQQGQLDWSEYDALMARGARNRVAMMLVLATCPSWACSDVSGPPTGAGPLAAQNDFARQAVKRYGNGGSFWASHPELPYLPVTDWQVGNEVNASAFWKPRPNAAEYARFLQQEAAVIRGADTRATVVLSGLTNEGDVPLGEFLRQLYAQPGFKSSFDVLAVHPYAGNDAGALKLLDVARSEMLAAGDGGKRVWVTEFGWGTAGPRLPNLPTPQRQAELLRSTYDALIGCRARWNLDRAYWFGYRDIEGPPSEADQPGYHTGLLDAAGRPKPAWAAIHDYSEGAEAPGAGTCTLDRARDTSPPETRIVAPRSPSRTGRTRLKLVASERRVRFECSLRRARKHTSRKSAANRPRWRRCRSRYRTPRLRRGRYKLLVRAVDARGNADWTPAGARLVLRGGRSVLIRVRVDRVKRPRPRHA